MNSFPDHEHPIQDHPASEAGPDRGSRWRKRLAWLGPIASTTLFIIALMVLWTIVSGMDFAKLKQAFLSVGFEYIGLALLFTVISYCLLTCYDALALWQLKIKIPYRITALASFTSYAISFTLGFPLLTAGTVRYWVYSGRGIRPSIIASLTVIAGFTFWIGMGTVLAWCVLRKAVTLSNLVYTELGFVYAAGYTALVVVVGYFVWVSLKRRSIRVQKWQLELPGFRVSLAQMMIGALDTCTGAAVFYVLMPNVTLGFETFLAVYVFAVMVGMFTHIPGGAGVFETIMLLALSRFPREEVFGALILYRIIYYLIPFIIALAVLGAYEIFSRMRPSLRALARRKTEMTTMPDPRTDETGLSRQQQSYRLHHILQGVGIALVGFLLWAGISGDINRWVAAAATILFGALLAASFLSDLRGIRRDHREQETDLPVMPPAATLLANIPDPIILINRRMMVFEINAAARDLLPSLRTGFPLSFSLRNPDVLGGIDQVLRSGESVKVQHIEKLPTERAFELQISLLRGDEQWVLLFFRDLTTARNLEKMRVDFIANVSHELRTPLASVIGFIETIQGAARDDAAAREKFLTVMLTQARRMARLIDDLLSLSRIELHVHVAPETPLELESIVRQIIPTLAPLATESGIEIALHAEGGPFVINGDRDEMLRVVENLAENAVKYGGEGGRIDITVRHVQEEDGQAAQVELSVRDYGAGIGPEHLPRLTERFYRTDTDVSRRKGGTGLGLAIVKHIVIRHRGRLTIESEPEKGALFRILLPARLQKQAASEPHS